MIQVLNAKMTQRDTSASVSVVGLEKIAKVSLLEYYLGNKYSNKEN